MLDPLQSALQPLLSDDRVAGLPLAERLLHVLAPPSARTRAGFAVLSDPAYAAFRDTVPHVLGAGKAVLATTRALVTAARHQELDDVLLENLQRSAEVVDACVATAAVTAPSDLWLVRFVLSSLCELSLRDALLAGDVVDVNAGAFVPHELATDLSLLVARALLIEPRPGTFRIAPGGRPAAVFAAATVLDEPARGPLARFFARAFSGGSLVDAERDALLSLSNPPTRTTWEQTTFAPTAAEIELGFRLLPVITGLRAAGRSATWAHDAAPLSADALCPADPAVGAVARDILVAAGLTDDDGGLSDLGRRVLLRGPGPMGIIEAYRPYLAALPAIARQGRKGLWVARGDNIAASQDANQKTFELANSALDRFMADTGFSPTVFIEHAIGRGEATRQRYAKSGDALRYVGADLEDAAIDACLALQHRGELPASMIFVRQADIGDVSRLTTALARAGLDPNGAVMVVGNGFHEVRHPDPAQADARMIEVFRGYHDAGIVLLFTEESALSVDDLLHTAWNTYHAGFKYVHDKSGQGLRPAVPGPAGGGLRQSWRACAEAAGYVHLDAYSDKSRSIYPTRPKSGHNPSISMNHFVVPKPLATSLGLA